MDRSRRGPLSKSFVSGGTNDSERQSQQGSQQQSSQQKQQTLQQKQPPQTPGKKEDAGLTVKPNMSAVPPVGSAAPVGAELTIIKEDDDNSFVDKNGKLKFKKIFLSHKKPSVRAKEKKIRQNRRLRKSILPKNALMALNEVKGITISEFNISANTTGGFIALVTVNDKQYEGKGISKNSAKNSACEKALRDYVLEKMRLHPRFAKAPATDAEAMDTTDGSDETQQKENDGDENEEADDVPMINLASFAIYKLFNEWENEGYVVPELHPSAAGTSATPSENGSTAGPKEPKKAPIRTELPTNWETMHPATLLCMMRPGLSYTEGGAIGEKPNVLQALSVVVDGTEFSAYGRSKKSARRNVAVDVCNSLFTTNFTKDEPSALVVTEDIAIA